MVFPASARQLIYDFIDAYNKGAFRKLDCLFAEEPDFAFYRCFRNEFAILR